MFPKLFMHQERIHNFHRQCVSSRTQDTGKLVSEHISCHWLFLIHSGNLRFSDVIGQWHKMC